MKFCTSRTKSAAYLPAQGEFELILLLKAYPLFLKKGDFYQYLPSRADFHSTLQFFFKMGLER
jgi:hypothetical protein